MKLDKIRRAILELEGWTEIIISRDGSDEEVWYGRPPDNSAECQTCPNYPLCHDAIQAFCAGRSQPMLHRILSQLEKICARDWKSMKLAEPAFCTPLQWCEAVLRAAVKWEEEL